MAILTTKYTIAWYGVNGDTECSNLAISDFLGSYGSDPSNPTYQGPWTDRVSDLSSVEIYGYEDGAPKTFFGANMEWGDLLQGFTELKCGRMYLIKNFALLPAEIPGLVPAADGVDMGRVVPV